MSSSTDLSQQTLDHVPLVHVAWAAHQRLMQKLRKKAPVRPSLTIIEESDGTRVVFDNNTGNRLGILQPFTEKSVVAEDTSLFWLGLMIGAILAIVGVFATITALGS